MAAEHGHTHPQAHSHFGDLARQTSARLGLALGITLAFVVVEAVAGWLSNSLALLTDAAHNVTDVLALGLTWYALRLTARPANADKTFGYHRAGILVALVNSVSLVVIALGIFYEAYHRLVAPPVVEANVLIGVSALAFFVNLGTAWLVHGGSRQDLSVRSAFVHLMGDVLSTVAAFAAGIAIFFTGLNWLDPVASALIGLLILGSAWSILRETLDILLEATPPGVDMSEMVRDVLGVPGVRGVHDLHVWSISQGLRSLSAHIVTDDIPISAAGSILADVNLVLQRRYGISHATLQLECIGCEPDALYCDLADAPTHPIHSGQTEPAA